MKNRIRNHISCRNCKVRNLCLPKSLDNEQVLLLEDIIQHAKTYAPGEHIYFENSKINEIYAIYSGVAKDYAITKEGNEYIKNFYLPGDILGLEFIHQGIFKLNAVAIKKTIACVIPISKITWTEIDGELSLGKSLFNILCQKFDNQTYFRLTTNARSRVAAFYLNMIHREKERNPSLKKIPIGMNNLDISNKLGLASETFSRVLHELIERNVLKFHDHHITRVDLSELEKIVES